MSTTNRNVFEQSRNGRPRLLFPFLAQFYTRGEPITYALLRVAFGLSILTHGIPKLFGMPHGSMADPMAGTTNLIGNVLGLPFAPQLAIFVALLETFGAIAIAIGFGTRLRDEVGNPLKQHLASTRGQPSRYDASEYKANQPADEL